MMNEHKPWMTICYNISKRAVDEVAFFAEAALGLRWIEFVHRGYVEAESAGMGVYQVLERSETRNRYLWNGEEFTIELRPR